MKEQNRLKTRNFAGLGRFAGITRQTENGNHITSFGQNAKNDETREILTHEIRDMKKRRKMYNIGRGGNKEINSGTGARRQRQKGMFMKLMKAMKNSGRDNTQKRGINGGTGARRQRQKGMFMKLMKAMKNSGRDNTQKRGINGGTGTAGVEI